ncbi:MAG TPA: glycosyltransferase [Acidimicrobiales bacterium]|nr:glycosyltransferase [Acidimicrobiales bacterium]
MTTVALVPAFNSQASVGSTVAALLDFVDEVVVIDDGSDDLTGAAATDAGAAVLRLDRNQGKAGAVGAGVEARPSADMYLLADADLGATAAGLRVLLGPVSSGSADMTIGILPSAGGRGGFGMARNLAAWGIERATRWRPDAPLSGQRAVRGPLLRALFALTPPGQRFGLETALSIDALEQGARLVEVPIEADHRHRGRSLAGFAHRGRQAADILGALWPRLTSRRLRIALMIAAFLAAVTLSHVAGKAAEPASQPLTEGRLRGPILLVGLPGVRIDDLDAMPNLSRLARQGALGALTVRTRTGYPTSTEGYASLGAGSRVDAETPAGLAFNSGEPLEGGVARDALGRRAGATPGGEVVVVGAPSAARQAGERASSLPGALGAAVHGAGLATAVIGNADTHRPRLIDDPQLGPTNPEEPEVPDVSRPAAVALMDYAGGVDLGRVDAGLLMADAAAPFGLRSDPEEMVAAVSDAVGRGADLLLVDPGDMDRAQAFADLVTDRQAEAHRMNSLARTDGLLPRIIDAVGSDATVVVFGVTPPAPDWHLTPLVIRGPSIRPGTLVHSPSTRRPGVAALTDLAPTVLDLLGTDRPAGMIGRPLRAASGVAADPGSRLSELSKIDRVASYRERIYLGTTMGYIAFQALLYLLALFVFLRFGGRGPAATALRLGVLAVAGHPVATFLHRQIPGVEEWGWAGVVVLVALDLILGALALALGRRRSLAPIGWIAAATIAVLVADVASGAHMQMSSLLGYSFHSAGRFTGFGNQAFAVLASTTILAGAIHVHYAPRRGEALVSTGLLFLFVAIIDGSPTLGSDVGGILTMVPVFGLTWFAIAGRKLSWRAVGTAFALTLLAVGLAAGVDFARPAESRTHLGRLVAAVVDGGPAPLLEIVGRKAAANLRTWGSPWVWGLAVLAISLITVLVVDRNWHRVLPTGSALRAGALGTVAAGILGYAANDSGVVVAALILVYLGPFLTIVALDRDSASLEMPPVAPAERPVRLVT